MNRLLTMTKDIVKYGTTTHVLDINDKLNLSFFKQKLSKFIAGNVEVRPSRRLLFSANSKWVVVWHVV
jgi:hypothetical protein